MILLVAPVVALLNRPPKSRQVMSESRKVRFPEDGPLGVLYVRDKGAGANWLEYGDARGDVVVPSGNDLGLRLTWGGLSNLPSLASLDQKDLTMLDASMTAI